MVSDDETIQIDTPTLKRQRSNCAGRLTKLQNTVDSFELKGELTSESIERKLVKADELQSEHQELIYQLLQQPDANENEINDSDKRFDDAHAKLISQLYAAKRKIVYGHRINDQRTAVNALENYKTKVADGYYLTASVDVINIHINNLNLTKQEHQKAWNDIMQQTSDELEKDELRRDLNKFNDTHGEILAHLMAHVKRLSPAPSAPQVEHAIAPEYNRKKMIDIKLPRLEIAKFDGTASTWTSFRDQFKSTIHNREGLDNVSKFHYLKSLITDTHSPISHLEVTDDGYESAWQLCLSKYDDKRIIIDSHFAAIISTKPMTGEDYEQLSKLIDTFLIHVSSLERMYSKEKLFDALIAHMAIFRLDAHTRDLVETDRKTEIPSWPELLEFLQKRTKVLKSLPKPKASAQKPAASTTTKSTDVRQSKTLVASRSTVCPLCSNGHALYQCSEFFSLNTTDRNAKVREKHLCFNCLGPHLMADCKSKSGCKTCQKKHHSLLHQSYSTSTSVPTTEASRMLNPHLAHLRQLQKSDPILNPPAKKTANVSSLNAESESFEPAQANCTASTNSKESFTLLSTAIVRVQDVQGQWHQARALLDTGSDSNFMTKSVAQALGIPHETVHVEANGLGAKSTIIDRQITATFASRLSDESYEAEFLVTQRITGLTPSRTTSLASIGIPSNIQLADPTFNQPGKIDLLIGNELFWDLIKTNRMKLDSGAKLIESSLGWIIGGSAKNKRTITTVNCHHSTISDLRDTMEKFYKLEDYRNDKRFFTDEEQHCEELFEQTHQRDENGRFIITIPFKENVDQLASNNGQAYHQFLALEKRLQKNDRLKNEYSKFMDEYEQLGHMQEVDPKKYSNVTRFYFPHHAVEKPDSTTTKVRVVFNGSAKTSSGLSLNDVQCVGPQIQSDGITLALKFRSHPVVIIADIAKMYRMIEVVPDQRHLQLIFWRKNYEEPVKTYELKTVTYGTACASFQSTRCLKQLAIEARNEFPQAANEVEKGFFVDDLISGSDTAENAIALYQQIDKIVAGGAMDLRKVFSNDQKFLKSIPEDKRETLASDDMTIKALGIKWRPTTDEIEFDVKPIDITKVTKRIVLSEIAKIYDPQGLIGPVIFTMKTLMKQMWLSETSWDEAPPDNITESWIKLASTITQLSSVRIKRHFMLANPTQLELHGFSDASDKGYGAVVYVRSTDIYGNIESHIICAKSRIAPKERRSTPRLELCGAVILVHVMKLVEKALTIPFAKKMCWTDSAIVLHWLKKEPSQLQPFVANRISEIQELSNDITWRHVPGIHNPADLISRGLTPDEIIHNKLWWHGPDFLTLDEDEWPESIVKLDEDTPEFKAEFKKVQMLASTRQEPNILIQMINNSSDLHRSTRIIAYARRFAFNARAKEKQQRKRFGPITCDEIQEAELSILRNFQYEYFPSEVIHLRDGKLVARSSPIKNLDPFWDSTDDIMRVGGRLRHAEELSQDHKHPIIIPKSQLSLLIARNAHESNMHPGKQATLSITRMRYWLIDAGHTINKVCRSCIRCFRIRPKLRDQFMGQLPAPRITPSPAFHHTGIDFAGPINMKTGYTRNAKTMKCYVALFVCLASKAVHLEIVSELSTKAFIASLDRFISRRGRCATIYSDHGTNFVGAKNQLQELKKLLNDPATNSCIRNHLNKQNIQWTLIPPRNPEHGGLWEAGVKSMKHHLNRVTQNANLHYEELSTLVCKIEAILNSRPIIPLSTDPNDLEALTTGHLLIGRPLVSMPQRNLVDQSTNHLERWDRIIQLQQDFWRRWSKEYLNRLQTRTKNFKDKIHVKVGQIVLIHIDNVPPMHWPLGIIEQVLPGRDGTTRVVKIRSADTTMTRPVNKIAILPMTDNMMDDSTHHDT